MESKNIYQRINAVMKEVQYVQKDAAVTGAGQNYKAVTHDQVVSVARSALVESGIIIYPEQVSGEFLIKRDMSVTPPVKMGLYSGSYKIHFVNIDNGEDRITVLVEAHANDNGDKAPGKALTYATKSAILKVLNLETGENDESRSAEPTYYTEVQKDQFDDLLAKNDAMGIVCFAQSVGPDVMTALNGSFKKGEISAGKQKLKDLTSKGWDQIDDTAMQISQLIEAEDVAVLEVTEELTPIEKKLVSNKLTAKEIEFIRSVKEI